MLSYRCQANAYTPMIQPFHLKPLESMRLGIFGGSFDPVHCGHLLLADCCAEQAKLDVVWFVPAAHQPLKPTGPLTNDEHRVAMLRLACDDKPKFLVSTVEIDRGGVSYTVDTLEAIHAECPDDELFFLMGADSLADLPDWHRPADICRLATPLVVHRAEAAPPDFSVLDDLVDKHRVDVVRQQLVEMPPTPISSSAIRKLISNEGAWQTLVPSAVADYIQRQQLYTER